MRLYFERFQHLKRNYNTGIYSPSLPRDNTRIKKRRVLSPSAASRGQCTIKDFSTRICRYPVARSLPRKNPFPSERIGRGNRDREAKERGRRGKGADGRQTEPSRYREGGRRIDAKGEERKKSGKMGSQLFFRLACCVPLAITRLERNIFSGLFPASLISNYESRNNPVGRRLRITPFRSPVVPFIHPPPMALSSSSRVSSKGSRKQ